MKVSSFGYLIAVVVLGVTIELVERESKQAAYALTMLLLLGMITFNAMQFRQQLSMIVALANAKPRRTPATATPIRK